MPLWNSLPRKIQKLKSVIAQLNRQCVLDTHNYLMLKILPLFNVYHILGCDPYKNAKVLILSAVFIIFLASLTHFLVLRCKYLRKRLMDYDKLPVSVENHYD